MNPHTDGDRGFAPERGVVLAFAFVQHVALASVLLGVSRLPAGVWEYGWQHREFERWRLWVPGAALALPWLLLLLLWRRRWDARAMATLVVLPCLGTYALAARAARATALMLEAESSFRMHHPRLMQEVHREFNALAVLPCPELLASLGERGGSWTETGPISSGFRIETRISTRELYPGVLVEARLCYDRLPGDCWPGVSESWSGDLTTVVCSGAP